MCLTGESRPRPVLMKKLAGFLGIGEAWLALGVKPDLGGHRQWKYSRHAEAAAYLAFGLFMANGFSCVFAEDHPDVDFFATKDGQRTPVSVTISQSKGRAGHVIPVKLTYGQLFNVAVILTGKCSFDVIVMDHDGVTQHGDRPGDYINVTVTKGIGYSTKKHRWVKLEDSELFR